MTSREAIETAISKNESSIQETQKQMATIQGLLAGFLKSKEHLISILDDIKIAETAEKTKIKTKTKPSKKKVT